MTTLLRMVAHLPPAFSRFVFGALAGSAVYIYDVILGAA